jgi:hypothetical protein
LDLDLDLDLDLGLRFGLDLDLDLGLRFGLDLDFLGGISYFWFGVQVDHIGYNEEGHVSFWVGPQRHLTLRISISMERYSITTTYLFLP